MLQKERIPAKMKILFYKKEGSEYRTPNDVANDDGETIEFEGTEIVNAESDDETSATLYTAGGYFYVTLTAEDIETISKLRKEPRP